MRGSPREIRQLQEYIDSTQRSDERLVAAARRISEEPEAQISLTIAGHTVVLVHPDHGRHSLQGHMQVFADLCAERDDGTVTVDVDDGRTLKLMTPERFERLYRLALLGLDHEDES